MTYNNEPTHTSQTIGNIALISLYRQSQAGNRIALEELNLLRAHQGQPPLSMNDVCPPMIGGWLGSIIGGIATIGLWCCALFAIGAVILYLVVIPIMLATGND